MPHIIVKLWPKPEAQKRALGNAITQSVVQHLSYGEDAVSVSFKEIAPADWTEKVYKPDIVAKSNQLYKKSGYTY